ncbi:SGNH/GDSL hydrolase family protein [Paenibacillus sp. BR1-192]|uniref:SGNH/GDSL hydrolase family protein n=1 Tax=Paenibacillus sp. BR1-192 TaxID=3032287 RepID=UPI00240E64C6|nr:SGNH/GDSL hydrolase family protein [Paenibacillus sp. BR1-192]WFB57468.1 SGNH/GDSL hydrolase family protein [Paenibacillus sp. BR1-192]
MAEIEIIKGADNGNPPDSLREMYPKINRNFQKVNTELIGHIGSTTAHKAEDIIYTGEATGNNVKQAVDGLDKRIDNLILESGNSDPEVADARGGYTVLGDRLNASDNRVADKASLSDLSAVNSEITALKNNKLDKDGTIIVPQISKNGGLIDQTYLTDELLQQISGNAPIHAVPADNSINYDKTTFFKSETNIFDKSKATPGIVNSSDGSIIPNSSWYASDYIAVSVGSTYKTTPCADYAYYNASKVFVSGVENPLGPATLTPPSNAVYVRITFQETDLDTAMVSKDNLPSQYLPYGSYVVDIVDPGLKEAINKSVNVTSKWTNKIWNVIGDSITEHNARTEKNYQDYIKDKIDCIVNNYGLSGTGWRTPSTSGGSDAFYQRMDTFAANADLITVFGGTNDWAEVGVPFVMGTFGDTDPATSFYGALDYTIRQLINKYPTKTIAVFTPIPRGPDPWAESYGTTMEQIADAVIKVANRYSVPALDLYREGNVYAWNTEYQAFALPDGLHPNDNGHMILADKILAFINTL